MTTNPTLYSTVVKLIATQPGHIPATQGRLGHAAFLDLIKAVDPALSETLHESQGRKPFTVSPLQDVGKAHNGQIPIKQGQELWLRFTLLGSDLFTTFIRYFLTPSPTLPLRGGGRREGVSSASSQAGEHPPLPGRGRAGEGVSSASSQAGEHPPLPGRGRAGEGVRLGGLHFAVSEILTTPGSHPWAGYTSLNELCRRWQAGPLEASAWQISLEFASPTAFSRGSRDGLGKYMEVFPHPAMLFGSLVAAWNDHLPIPLDKAAIRAYAEETVVVGLYQMESRMFRYWGQPQIGAIGTVTYRLQDKQDEAMLRALNLLADFAFYSGVGYKTTMGMGQVRRISNQ